MFFKNKAPRVAFLISGRGSNMMAILRAIKGKQLKANPVLVFSNKSKAAGLQRAHDFGVKTETFSPKSFASKKDYEERLVALLKENDVEWVICAGYMRILGKPMLAAFKHRIVNIHPSLLPSFPGLDAQKQAVEAGVKVSGCTIHLVDEGVDTGPIILQKAVAVDPEDTDESLAKKIIKIEHDSYWRALKLVFKGFTVRNKTVVFK